MIYIYAYKTLTAAAQLTLTTQLNACSHIQFQQKIFHAMKS